MEPQATTTKPRNPSSSPATLTRADEAKLEAFTRQEQEAAALKARRDLRERVRRNMERVRAITDEIEFSIEAAEQALAESQPGRPTVDKMLESEPARFPIDGAWQAQARAYLVQAGELLLEQRLRKAWLAQHAGDVAEGGA